jgi:DNA-directed RNA polymerase specialized sigma24 family protein
MEVSAELLEEVRRGKTRAAVELLGLFYPVVYRMAHSLTGRADSGDGVVRFVMKRSFRVMPNWDNEGQPARWFYHHTVLASRRTLKHASELATDPLIVNAETGDAYYPAFVRALRVLPMQQREAFLFHHGERWNPRLLAVAMDCSTEAAQNHLREATAALSRLAGDMFPTYTAHLAHAYQKLTPATELVLNDVKLRVRRYAVPRRLATVARVAFTLAALAGIAWLVWSFRGVKWVV